MLVLVFKLISWGQCSWRLRLKWLRARCFRFDSLIVIWSSSYSTSNCDTSSISRLTRLTWLLLSNLVGKTEESPLEDLQILNWTFPVYDSALPGSAWPWLQIKSCTSVFTLELHLFHLTRSAFWAAGPNSWISNSEILSSEFEMSTSCVWSVHKMHIFWKQSFLKRYSKFERISTGRLKEDGRSDTRDNGHLWLVAWELIERIEW